MCDEAKSHNSISGIPWSSVLALMIVLLILIVVVLFIVFTAQPAILQVRSSNIHIRNKPWRMESQGDNEVFDRSAVRIFNSRTLRPLHGLALVGGARKAARESRRL
jgi:hypothetical protein